MAISDDSNDELEEEEDDEEEEDGTGGGSKVKAPVSGKTPGKVPVPAVAVVPALAGSSPKAKAKK